MTWLLFALIGPICWMIANFVDKYTVEHFVSKETDAGMLVLFTSLTGLVFLPFVYFGTRGLFAMPILSILGLIGTGMLLIFGFVFYCRALQYDDASNVVPFFQLNPVFVYILGLVFLHEYISASKTLGGLLILIGVFFFSYNHKQKRFKKEVVRNMVLAALFTSSTLFLYKFFTIQEANFWNTFFWELLGYVIAGVGIFLCIPSYRRNFLDLLYGKDRKIILYSSTSEVISTLGNLTAQYATLFAPLFFVALVNSFQPVMTFVFGYILTKSSIKLNEDIRKETLVYKYIGLAILTAGTIVFIVI